MILCYHAVDDTWESSLSTRVGTLTHQVEWLVRTRRYRPAHLEEALRNPWAGLHITFDDGYRSLTNALPVLERAGLTATLFVCTSITERRAAAPATGPADPRHLETLGWEELREIVACGHAVGSHTVTHPYLPALSDQELRDELKDSKEAVEDHLARPCSVLAYPYGGEDHRVRAAARRAGYDAAFGAPGNPLARDSFSVPRIVVVRQDGAGVRFNVKTTHAAQAGRHALRKVSRLSNRLRGAQPSSGRR